MLHPSFNACSAVLKYYPINLFIPKLLSGSVSAFPLTSVSVSAIIPTYKPPQELKALVHILLTQSCVRQVVVVDDATPTGWEEFFASLARMAEGLGRSGDLTVLQLTSNNKRAGAVNRGLTALTAPPSPLHDVLVLDDDVVLSAHTILSLVETLHTSDQLGAVCTQARVSNRHENILTRLQGLEYVGFNVARIADRGFLLGPLIMHGLASLIRSTVLVNELKGYDQTQLLEDYDLTVRIKSCGYHVALADPAIAGTVVPASFGQLWRQRVRWQYGGLRVIAHHWRQVYAVLPDLISHFLTLTLLGAIIISLVWHQSGNGESTLITIVRATSIGMSVVFYMIQLCITIMLDKGKDWWDVLIRMMIIPELMYSMMLSLILFGSYIFYCYTVFRKRLSTPQTHSLVRAAIHFIDAWFRVCGYTTTWGTK
ncbi:MAG: glycosyltransferase family 2 protein [Patescibacteria group bacterium]